MTHYVYGHPRNPTLGASQTQVLSHQAILRLSIADRSWEQGSDKRGPSTQAPQEHIIAISIDAVRNILFKRHGHRRELLTFTRNKTRDAQSHDQIYPETV